MAREGSSGRREALIRCKRRTLERFTTPPTLTVDYLLRGRLVVVRLDLRGELVCVARDLVLLLLGPGLFSVRNDSVLGGKGGSEVIEMRGGRVTSVSESPRTAPG